MIISFATDLQQASDYVQSSIPEAEFDAAWLRQQDEQDKVSALLDKYGYVQTVTNVEIKVSTESWAFCAEITHYQETRWEADENGETPETEWQAVHTREIYFTTTADLGTIISEATPSLGQLFQAAEAILPSDPVVDIEKMTLEQLFQAADAITSKWDY